MRVGQPLPFVLGFRATCYYYRKAYLLGLLARAYRVRRPQASYSARPASC